MGEVGTTKIYEDDKIIMWEFILEPGERTPIHTHEHDYVFHALEGAPLQVFDINNKDLGTLPVGHGDTYAFKVEGDNLVSTDGKGHCVPVTHAAVNKGATRYREILVESK